MPASISAMLVKNTATGVVQTIQSNIMVLLEHEHSLRRFGCQAKAVRLGYGNRTQ
jgi:hypothetical protein